jgi:hypothetical protein
MKQVAVTDLAAYFDDEITAMPNLVTTAATTVGALNSGSITSGFGAIDNGSSNITTTGVGTFASLDISGNIDVDGTTNLDAVDIDSNVQLDGTFTVGTDGSGQDVILYSGTSGDNFTWDASEEILTITGTNGQTSLDVADGNLVVADNIDLEGDIDVNGTSNLDNTDIDGTFAVDGATISLDASTSFNIDNTNTSNGVTINTATSGGPISIGHTISETTVNDNLNVTGALMYNSKIVSTKSDGTTLAASESGSVILQSTNSATITLPATVAGLRYTFVWAGTAGQTFNISPNSSDRIMGSILDVADGNIVTAASSGVGVDNKDLQLDSGSQVGDRVTRVADGNNGWYIEQALGSWAFES